MSEFHINTRLQLLYQVLFEKNCSFVTYRLPQTNDIITMIADKSTSVKTDKLELINTTSGFVFTPFDNKESTQIFVLNPDLIIVNDEFDDALIQQLRSTPVKLFNDSSTLSTTTYGTYTRIVDLAVQQLKLGKLAKVVLSKIRKVPYSANFDIGSKFLDLCATYPNAMTYLSYLPKIGCWMGATPEQLVIAKENVLETVSLAGTQVASEKELNEYAWEPKEIEEQAIVTDFIEESIKKTNPDELRIYGPENYKAGNLIHLRTLFQFKWSKSLLLNELLHLLHPTPSVGGLPKEEAFQFIKNNESYPRTFYTGFLGPVNIKNETQLFVNLRCVQLFENDFVLYSGAGITASSVADNEWYETESKMLTMLKVLNQ